MNTAHVARLKAIVPQHESRLVRLTGERVLSQPFAELP